MNKEKMKARCEEYIKDGQGSCRAPITYKELNGLLNRLSHLEATVSALTKGGK